MQTQQVAIIWNPTKVSREELEHAIPDLHRDSEKTSFGWYETTETDAGQDATNRAISEGSDLVIAAGGDGTVRAVAEALASSEADIDFAVLPLGTGNLFARNLGVPLKDLNAAFARALHPSTQRYDIGWVEFIPGVEEDDSSSDFSQNKKHRHAFVVIAGFGVDAEMISETDPELKQRLGWFAYLQSLGKAVSQSNVINLTITVDKRSPSHKPAHTVMVGNCGTIQGGITILPDADPSDGKLDLILLSSSSLIGWINTLKNVVWDNGLRRLFKPKVSLHSSKYTIHQQFTTLTVELSSPRLFQIDGEKIGEASRLRFTIQHEALTVR